MATDSNNLCQFKNCDKKYVERCEYCDKKYCKAHINPSLILSLNQIINEPNEARRNLLHDEYDKEDVHPCPAYTQNFWKSWYTDKNFSSNVAKSETKSQKAQEDLDLKNNSDNKAQDRDKTIQIQKNSKIKISFFKKRAHDNLVEDKTVRDKKVTTKIEEKEAKTEEKPPQKKGFFGNIKDSLGVEEN